MLCKGYENLDLLSLDRSELEIGIMSIWSNSMIAMEDELTTDQLFLLGHNLGLFTGLKLACPFTDLRKVAEAKANIILEYLEGMRERNAN